jgi:DNA-binding XRE family transcriptional regulator
MPNIAKVLKEEIQRLARKETKAPASQLRRGTIALKRALSEMKRRLARVERDIHRMVILERKRSGQAPVVEEATRKVRFTSKGIRSLRRRLKVSQADFAKLVGVSALSVYQWERKEGPLQLRKTTRSCLADIRSIGRKEALKRLRGDTKAPEKNTKKPTGKIRHRGKPRTKKRR